MKFVLGSLELFDLANRNLAVFFVIFFNSVVVVADSGFSNLGNLFLQIFDFLPHFHALADGFHQRKACNGTPGLFVALSIFISNNRSPHDRLDFGRVLV